MSISGEENPQNFVPNVRIRPIIEALLFFVEGQKEVNADWSMVNSQQSTTEFPVSSIEHQESRIMVPPAPSLHL
jgi:hypothetical protein